MDKDGNVYVTDTFNDRVEMFDADGEFISTFGKNGDGPADFERPKGIAVDCDGHIWVVDAAQNLVKVFDQQGRLLIYFGGAGKFPGPVHGAVGNRHRPINQVVVSETFPGRVQVFRYITDAEAAAEKARRESELAKTGGIAGDGRAQCRQQRSCRRSLIEGRGGGFAQSGHGPEKGFRGAIAPQQVLAVDGQPKRSSRKNAGRRNFYERNS